jgi:hypothetical protein
LRDVRRAAPDDAWVVDRDELRRRFAALPDTFPQTRRYAAELTAGEGHDRFDFTVALMIDGVGRVRVECGSVSGADAGRQCAPRRVCVRRMGAC